MEVFSACLKISTGIIAVAQFWHSDAPYARIPLADRQASRGVAVATAFAGGAQKNRGDLGRPYNAGAKSVEGG